MKRVIMLLTLGTTMAVMLALAGSASAANPERETFQDEGTGVLANCGGFKALDDWVLDGQQTTYFDRAGNPDYARVHLQFQDFFYNSKTGEGFAETNTLTEVFDLQSGTQQLRGLAYHVTVPGEGVVLLDAGKLSLDAKGDIVFEAGSHQIEGSNTDTQKLCEALA